MLRMHVIRQDPWILGRQSLWRCGPDATGCSGLGSMSACYTQGEMAAVAPSCDFHFRMLTNTRDKAGQHFLQYGAGASKCCRLLHTVSECYQNSTYQHL